MAIITAIYSFSLRLSLTPPLPRLVLVRDRLLFSLSVSHAHTYTHTLSLLLPVALPLRIPPFRRPEQADALVWPASARLAVNESLNPPSSPPRLLSRCWPVSSKPRDLPSFECNVRHGCTQTKTPDLLLSLPLSLLTSIVLLLSTSIERTLARANFSDGCRFPRDARYRWGCNHHRRRLHQRRSDSIAVGQVRMHGPTRA